MSTPIRPRATLSALAITMVVSWGTLFYGFTLYLQPMHAELGISRATLAGAFSIGLLTSALLSMAVGNIIDRFSGRGIMTVGSLLASGGFFVWSRVHDVATLYAVWVTLGAAMAMTLYEPAFAVLTRQSGHTGDDYRRRIMLLTLVGGFASTVFVPLGAWFVRALGWRDALLVDAAMNLCICVPLHWRCLPGHDVGQPRAQRPAKGFLHALRQVVGMPVFWALVLTFMSVSAIASVLSSHLIHILADKGLALSEQLWIVALIGPTQVAGRIIVFRSGAIAPVRTGPVIYTLLVGGMLGLLGQSFWLMVVAIALFGAANGINTMLRATAVPELISREAYGTLTGALVMPALLAQAAAPWVAALLADVGGYRWVEWALVGLAVTALAAFCAGVSWPRRVAPPPLT